MQTDLTILAGTLFALVLGALVLAIAEWRDVERARYTAHLWANTRTFRVTDLRTGRPDSR